MHVQTPLRTEPHPTSTEPDQLTPRGVAKFTAVVALSAIFTDATLGHGLLWENDPYWTYWVTKTFLIATIFGLGTAWGGVGPGKGAVISGVHTIVLTVYYWTLSPVGLPSSPVWLDLEHTWITGVPVHFTVIYIGYLLALWVWNNRETKRQSVERAQSFGTSALALGIAVVVLGGLATTILTGAFPGVTWFVVRLLLTVTFILTWRAIAGRDPASAVAGGITLALAWAAYGHFLGPSGLPDMPLRITDASPPGATANWLGYRDIWLINLPVHALLMSAILLAGSGRARDAKSYTGLAFPAVFAVILIGSSVVYPEIYRPTEVTISANDGARVEAGDWFSGSFEEASATLDLQARDVGGRVTPLPPHDFVDLDARIQISEGTFTVNANIPMVSDPAGRFTTWWGVGVNAEHHGRSGIGTDRIPAINSPVAIFALGNVAKDGRPIATNVPVHFMTSREPVNGAKAELDVGDPELASIPGLPGGHLRVVWSDFTGAVPKGGHFARYVLGAIVLIMFLGASLGLVRQNNRVLDLTGI